MSNRAVVLAGGKGTRLRPYTVVFPKPLMPLGDYPILEVIVRQLALEGFDHITMAVNHQANLNAIGQIVFGDGKIFALNANNGLLTVNEPPLAGPGVLSIVPAGNKVVVSWPNAPPGLILQSSPAVSPVSWGRVPLRITDPQRSG